MSIKFDWPRFSDQFHLDAKQMLDAALNKGSKPPIIADRIEVVELDMGSEPPELEIRDIGDLTMEQFRGIFKLSYTGNAFIVLRTKVQVNPLNHRKKPDIGILGGTRGVVAAHQPLVVPMLLRLSHFKLNAYVVLVLSKQKGITLVFKTDPLQHVEVSSTFDSIAVIQKYIQREIEGQLREMFREDLPGIIHRLSQRWVAGRTKVEAPYLAKLPTRQPPPPPTEPSDTTASPEVTDIQEVPHLRDLTASHPFPFVGLHPSMQRHSLLPHPLIRPPPAPSSSSSTRATSQGAASELDLNPAVPSIDGEESYTSFPDIENFDPTYGLRPDGLPVKSGYSGLGRLWQPSKGLRDLNEEDSDVDEVDSFDMISWIDAAPDFTAPDPSDAEEDTPVYETIPAVGGGTITRPRIYHSQSLIQPPLDVGTRDHPSRTSSLETTRSLGPQPLRPSSSVKYSPEQAVPIHLRQRDISRVPGSDNALTADAESSSATRFSQISESVREWRRLNPPVPPSLGRKISIPLRSSELLQSSSGIAIPLPTPPSSDIPPPSPQFLKSTSRTRSPSPGGSNIHSFEGLRYGSPPPIHYHRDENGGIVLRPGLSNTVTQLSTLSHSNHTLSPYTRSVEHFTVRTVPPRPPPVPAQPVKAKRKRLYRIRGGKKKEAPEVLTEQVTTRSISPSPPSEFSDVNHYFRPRDTFPPEHSVPPEFSPTLRRRTSYQGF